VDNNFKLSIGPRRDLAKASEQQSLAECRSPIRLKKKKKEMPRHWAVSEQLGGEMERGEGRGFLPTEKPQVFQLFHFRRC
jgi:hypothetical protein